MSEKEPKAMRDYKQEFEKRVEFIRNLVEQSHTNGIICGIYSKAKWFLIAHALQFIASGDKNQV